VAPPAGIRSKKGRINMASKKNIKSSPSSNLPALKIGSRVRCTDDGVTGRIVWANGVSVKITWDDGERVTWKRDSLASRPIEFLDPEDPPTAEPNAEQQADPVAANEATAQEEPPVPMVEVPAAEPIAEAWVPEGPSDVPRCETADALPSNEASASPEIAPSETVAVDSTATEPPSTATEPNVRRKAKKPETASGSEKKRSALDGAARVLAETGMAMTCREMIDAMAAKGYWESPGGKTPHATLYSAIAREITTKGANSRFAKAERGKFARSAGA
jgi:hypothetical protein